jgi:hypothetical protein
VNLKHLLIAFCLTGFACASSTPPQTSETVSAAEASTDEQSEGGEKKDAKVAKSEKDKEVTCEMEHVVGSNLPKRVCRSRSQRERERRESQDAVNNATRQGRGRASN